MSHFHFYNKQDVLSVTRNRRFETKLGEKVQLIADAQQLEVSLSQSSARYVLFGIPEDIGIKANYGTGGASSAWMPFLNAFLNTQSNDFLYGEEILVLGHFDFSDLSMLIESNARQQEEMIDAYRHAVNTIDDEVESLVKLITAAKKIPIVIGGGHNNAYPLLKGSAKGLHKADLIQLPQINCISLDAHADYRPLEGRHSGNAFRYAEEDGYLQKYCVVGLQENYLQQNVWVDIVNNPFIDCITYEDIFIRDKRSFVQAVAMAIEFTEDNYTGIELDLDCVEGVLSSAATPSGISATDARKYVSYTGSSNKVAYLHICEGAAELADGRKSETTGKLISYLVSDFIKQQLEVK
jgi:formiminoglutamase